MRNTMNGLTATIRIRRIFSVILVLSSIHLIHSQENSNQHHYQNNNNNIINVTKYNDELNNSRISNRNKDMYSSHNNHDKKIRLYNTHNNVRTRNDHNNNINIIETDNNQDYNDTTTDSNNRINDDDDEVVLSCDLLGLDFFCFISNNGCTSLMKMLKKCSTIITSTSPTTPQPPP